MTKILRRLAYLVVAGLLVVVFLVFAQVNFDDLRLRAGHLRLPPVGALYAGGFYALQKDGVPDGPVCMVQTASLIDDFTESTDTIKISNWLGASLPTIVRWTKNLLVAIGLEEIHVGNADGTPWEGYKLVRKIDDTRIVALSRVQYVIDQSFKNDPDCERNVNLMAERGECVIVITRLARDVTDGGSNFGFGISDQSRCIISAKMTEPVNVPTPPFRLMSRASTLKSKLGLLE